MNSESILKEKVEEGRSNLTHFNFSAVNINNNNGTLEDVRTIEEIKTKEESENIKLVEKTEENLQRRTSGRTTKGVPFERFSYKAKDNPSTNTKEPQSFKEILKLPKTDQQKWFQVMTEEIESLKENDVYEQTYLKASIQDKI